MRPSRFTEEQIIGMLKEQEAGAATADVCRKHGISSATSYNRQDRAAASAFVTSLRTDLIDDLFIHQPSLSDQERR